MHRRLRLLLPAACALGLLLPAGVSATPDPASPAAARRALWAAREALSPAQPLSAGPTAGSRDATAALRDLALALPALHGAQRQRARGLLQRPANPSDRDYFGREAPESPLCDAHFCVHWSDRGRNAPRSRAFVDQVQAATQRSHAAENVRLGWREAKPDGGRGAAHGRGGEGQVDVYLTNLPSRLYGYSAPDPGQGGARRSAYLVLDNDYSGFPSSPLASMRVTVAHEYNHILQFNYDTFEALWMFEASATWMEEQVYPAIDDYLNYLPGWASQPQEPLTGKEKIYGDSVWNHWLDSRYGPAVVRDAWATSLSTRPRHESVKAYATSIRRSGGRSFAREFAAFAAATAEWRASRAFPDASRYPDVERSGRLTSRSRRLRLDNTAYRLYRVEPRSSGGVSVKLRAQRGTHAALALVGRDGGPTTGSTRIASRYLGHGDRARVHLAHARRYERITAVAINADARGRAGQRIANNRRFVVRLGR